MSVEDMEVEERRQIRSLNWEQLLQSVTGMGEKPFRAKQLYEWIHQKNAASFEEMTNLSRELREKLEKHFILLPLKIIDCRESKDKDTSKYLFQLSDGHVVESVWMRYRHGNSICISSQVGCRMGCRFCASTLDGLTRNLTVGELLSQIYEIEREKGEKASHVVVMGTGEPLDNYENMVSFLRMLTEERGRHLSQRGITVSTCGLIPKIYDLARERLAITLAISLHAPNDAIRKKLMPIACKYTMQEIKEACRFYFETTGRRITFEYSLVQGVNDSEACAGELVRWLSGMNAHVNLIPVNPIAERDYQQTGTADIRKFQRVLEKNRIQATVRREMGRDIDGACGQLRKRYMDARE